MRKNSNVQSVCTDSTYVTGTGTRAYRNFFMQGYVTSYLVGTRYGNYSDRKHYTCQFEKTYSRTVSESRIKIFRIRILPTVDLVQVRIRVIILDSDLEN